MREHSPYTIKGSYTSYNDLLHLEQLLGFLEYNDVRFVQYNDRVYSPKEFYNHIQDLVTEKDRDYLLELQHKEYTERIEESGIPTWIADIYQDGSFYRTNQDLNPPEDILPF